MTRFRPKPMFPPVDTRNTAAVRAAVVGTFAALYPRSTYVWLDRLFADIEAMFAGRNPNYCAVDLHYHDWEHTLQATVCLNLILEGRGLAGVEPRIDARHFELAIAAVLLHDSGYLKLRSDAQGTGAKYTFCHVLRSCAFAATYLPVLGVTDKHLEAVLAAINCTGPANEISRLRFGQRIDCIIGGAVATADYLGQMAAPDYPDKLGVLYQEFEESDEYLHVPRSRRAFASPEDLMARTPQFWYKFVRPKLESDFQAVYRFLARPYPAGDNAYLDAIESNISEIQRRTAQLSRQPAAVVSSVP